MIGYSNTFTPFRNMMQSMYDAGRWSDALAAIKGVNRYQWLNRIDAFDTAEEMWVEEGNYCPEEIVGYWLTLTSV